MADNFFLGEYALMSLGKMTHDDTEEDKNNLVNTAAKNTTSSE